MSTYLPEGVGPNNEHVYGSEAIEADLPCSCGYDGPQQGRVVNRHTDVFTCPECGRETEVDYREED